MADSSNAHWTKLKVAKLIMTVASASQGGRTAAHVIAILALLIVAAAAQPQDKAREEAVRLGRKELAATLSIREDQLRLIGITATNWRDTSLGCAERGTVYAPVLTSGFKVTLGDADREHVVHVAGTRAVVCGARDDVRISSAPVIATSLKAADLVRQTLSADLSVDPRRVQIVSVRPSPPAECASAPAKAQGLAQVVEARVDSRTFRYYTDDAVTRNCDALDRSVS